MPKIPEEAKRLREIWGAFRSSRVLMTANNYRVFDHLKRPQSAREISQKLNTGVRATEILLDALTGLGLLKKSAHKYRNTSISNRFLVKDSPYYQGDIIRHADNLWKSWSGLDEVLKTVKTYQKAEDYDAFILGMHNIASLKAKDVIKAIGLKGIKTALDLGGGPGTYSMEMAKRGVKVTLFDYPEAIEIAKRLVEKEGVKRVSFIDGDFMIDDIGKGYDLIFVSQILHAYSERDNLQILRKCREALNEGGRIVVHEFYISEDRTHPIGSALFSVNMLIGTKGGRCYSPSEIKKWLLKVELRNIKEKLMDDTALIEGIWLTSMG
jgi:2-polyprenyl-3-methyl-5-hydroxy-6-metoxy-1,4-benzoquinol methylase